MILVLYEDFNVFLYVDKKSMNLLYSTQVCCKFLVGREIGRGSSGVVREGYAKGEDNSKVAMKFINKQKWPTKYSAPEDLLHEVKILQDLEHPCITKVIEAI